MLEGLGFAKIVTFHEIPCEVYFHPGERVTLSVGCVGGVCWLKGSKHYYIKAMETKRETAIYSRLQEITKFMNYLKRDLPEFHCTAYYISEITPKIAINSFRQLPRLQALLEEYDALRGMLGEDVDEEGVLSNLELLREAGVHDLAVRLMEEVMLDRQRLKQRLSRLEAELQGAVSILNEWVEKGHAIAVLWTVSTRVHVCRREDLEAEVREVLRELRRIEGLSVKARAYQQGLWIEEVGEPSYVFYAELVGLLHPAMREAYKDVPVLGEFVEAAEEWFNARLTSPIRRSRYVEEPSTAVAEALAAFLRQVRRVEELPARAGVRFRLRGLKRPVYFGLVAVRSGGKVEATETLFMVELDELRKHCLITGCTGSGKTRVAQLIAESACIHVPTIIIDPMGEFTGMIRENRDAAREREFRLERGVAYRFARIYTLDDSGIRFRANLLKRPSVSEELLVANADEAALVLSELVGDARLRDAFRDALLRFWRRGETPSFVDFVDEVRGVVGERRTASKLDRLMRYSMLMSGDGLDVEELLRHPLTIFCFNSPQYSEHVKLMATWLVMRELLNYFLGQPHSERLRALLVVDEVHRLYEAGVPRGAAVALEGIVKQGRAKGLGVVMASQTIKDLGDVLTQVHIRILMRILEEEIQQYGLKFGLDLARKLHSLEPRCGYVFYGSQGFFCKFRPTLSMPKGLESLRELEEHHAPEKALRTFREQVARVAAEPPRVEAEPSGLSVSREPLTDDERDVLALIRAFGGVVESKLKLQRRLGWGRQKILRVLDSLERKGKIAMERVGNRTIIRLTS